MQIKSFLSQRRVQCGADAQSKKKALQLLAQMIAEDIADLKEDEVFTSLMAREKLGSTGLGNGIAIPHCRVKNCHRIIGALMTLDKGVDFDSIDGNPVDIIFALMVPEEANDNHLKALAALAERMSESSYLHGMRDADDIETLYEAAISLDE